MQCARSVRSAITAIWRQERYITVSAAPQSLNDFFEPAVKEGEARLTGEAPDNLHIFPRDQRLPRSYFSLLGKAASDVIP